jgi:heme A synthase
MTTGALLELVAALAIIALGIWQYRKRRPDGGRGDAQGGVLLMLVGAIVAMHALGAFDYRPSQSEIDAGRPAPVTAQ